MKNSRICPKCAGTDIVYIKGRCGAYRSGNNILVGMTIFSAIPVNRYVCMKCGYSEEWIDQEDLHKLKEKYG